MSASRKLALLALPLVFGSTPLRAEPISQTPVPIDHVFVPAGFDSNDNVEVVVTGYLPDLCYKAPRAQAEIKGNRAQVSITALKIKDPSVFCVQLAVPFMEVATLGVMDPGKYSLDVNAGQPTSRQGRVLIGESSSPAMDDFVYANVTNIDRVAGTRKIVLKGTNPSDCYDLREIRFVSNDSDTYSVLPILKQVKADCRGPELPFVYEAEVPTELKADELLLHVRVMNGKSVNMLFNERE
jgi:hypothetical protein